MSVPNPLSLAVPKRLPQVGSLRYPFFCFSLPTIPGAIGFIVGPPMARRGLRQAERLYPQEAYAARRRDQGFSWGR